jgi:hypothetical protein
MLDLLAHLRLPRHAICLSQSDRVAETDKLVYPEKSLAALLPELLDPSRRIDAFRDKANLLCPSEHCTDDGDSAVCENRPVSQLMVQGKDVGLCDCVDPLPTESRFQQLLDYNVI